MADTWQETTDRVSSWIEDENRCVTTQRICQSADLSRREASQLLHELVEKDPTKSFQITTCEQVQENDVTVFRLRNSTTFKNSENSTIFALASLEATESVATAHERDMVDWRERVADGRHRQQLCDASWIAPATEIEATKDQTETGKGFAAVGVLSDAPTLNKHKAFTGKAKATTAASFFSKTDAKESATSTFAKPTNKAADKTTSIPSRAPRPSKAKENTVRKNQVAPLPEKVGNADDFVADEEESDDEEVIQKENSKKVAVEARRKAVDEANKQSNKELDESDGGKTNTIKATGAMDSFTTKTAPKSAEANPVTSGRQRKRRKKLVEKTTMVNGYLRTETQVVWEDVSTDEEEEEKQRAIASKKASVIKKSTSNRNPQGMKQRSLTGFFAKK